MNSNEAVPGGYERLTIYQLGRSLALRAHALSLGLPAFEMFEEGSQLRRASKRVSACIVEGYAQRPYKREYIRYLYRSLGSSDESKEHLKYLLETGSARNTAETTDLIAGYGSLSRQITCFIAGVERHHRPPVPGSPHDRPASGSDHVRAI